MVEFQGSNVYFSQGEYLVADTAYEPSEHVVPAFKSSPGMGLWQPPEKQQFNISLSSPRVTAEHTTAIDDENRIPDRSVLDMALPGGALPGARRDQLFAFVCETFVPNMHFNTFPDSIEIDLDSELELNDSSGEDSE
jgi:hypothetical protein